MKVELYTFSGTPYGWIVQLGALAKGITLNIHWIQPTPDELKSEKFLAFNPRGKVPVLKVDDFVLYESSAILAYFDGISPNPPFFGSSTEEAGLVEQVIAEINCYLSQSLPKFAAPIFIGKERECWPQLIEAAEVIMTELEFYESKLADRDFVALQTISGADIMFYPLVAVFLRAANKPSAAELNIPSQFNQKFPNILRWMKKIEAIPRYETTIPRSWD